MLVRKAEIADIEIPVSDIEKVLKVYPVAANGKIELPEDFKEYESVVAEMMKHVPLQEGIDRHFVTIHNGMITYDKPLRREGLHIDGNYCVDPVFSYGKDYRKTAGSVLASWGGVVPTWAGSGLIPKNLEAENLEDMFDIVMPFEPALGIPMEFGTYVSENLGGIICASSSANCLVHETDNIDFEIGDGGACNWGEFDKSKFTKLQANKINFMSSNMPHESVGGSNKMRALVRITLNHKYNNQLIAC